jgi:hypothetical protein
MFEAPAKAVEGHRLVQLLERVEKGGDVLVVADVHAEGDAPLDELRHVLCDQAPHLLGLDDDRGAIEVFVIVGFRLQNLAGPSILVAMRQGGIEVLPGADWRCLRDRFELRIHHVHRTAVAELQHDERHAHVEAVAPCEPVHHLFGLGITPPAAVIDDRGHAEPVQAVNAVDQRADFFVGRELWHHRLEGYERPRVAVDHAGGVATAVLLEFGVG